MTTEYLALQEHIFVKNFIPMSSDQQEIYRKLDAGLELGKDKIFYKQNELSTSEGYIFDLLRSICIFLDHFSKLGCVVSSLSNHNNRRKSEYHRYNFLECDMEFFYICLIGTYDRILYIINNLLRLDIEHKKIGSNNETLKKAIKDNEKLDTCLQAIDSYLDSYKKKRNQLCHRHSFIEPKYKGVEAIHLLPYEVVGLDQRRGLQSIKNKTPANNKLYPWLEETLKKTNSQLGNDVKKRFISELIKEETESFQKINAGLAELIIKLFDVFDELYKVEINKF
jgi:hypothetical protein